MDDVTMRVYEVAMSTRGASPRTEKLLVMAVSAAAADEWANAHTAANGLVMADSAKPVPDVAAWSKKNDSVDLAAELPPQANGSAAAK